MENETDQKHIYRQQSKVMKSDRYHRNRHKGCIIWLTGLSGSGKSSISFEIERLLFERNVSAYVLDGDNLRHGLNRDLGFSADDRRENIRRSAEAAKLFVDAGIITLLSLISPYRVDRDAARALFEAGDFIEVYVKCPLDVCEQRDPKGLYKKARTGEIREFTGISAPYEPPLQPEIVIQTDSQTLIESAEQIMQYLRTYQYLQD
ncbi:adenylyl-sulfate kinase [Paenibacillus sedimenti]|uniref:Adenylyl-sulfate kinase n=1 Tax=Paenibacillus sedimenti TaxID=2770274 RepID=A0A926KXU6_9BACL|nr:adenylyl-sulfate kinase [Paenibacillus sedimenti]MBD0384248.1 adenylyl-sulfate kinase [Paenibacillus sedimenti]